MDQERAVVPSTWTQLGAVVSALLGDPDQIAYASSVVEAAILSSAREIAQELHLCEEDTTLTTVANQTDYPLDSSAPGGTFNGQPYRIKKVMLSLSNANWVPLKEASTRAVNVYLTTDVPRQYAFYPYLDSAGGPVLSLNPIPPQVYTLRVWANTIPGDSTANPNGPSLPAEAEDLCILRAVRRLSISPGNRGLDQDILAEEPLEIMAARRGKENAVRGRDWR